MLDTAGNDTYVLNAHFGKPRKCLDVFKVSSDDNMVRVVPKEAGPFRVVDVLLVVQTFVPPFERTI